MNDASSLIAMGFTQPPYNLFVQDSSITFQNESGNFKLHYNIFKFIIWHQSARYRCTGLFNDTRVPDTAAQASSMTLEQLTPLHRPLPWHRCIGLFNDTAAQASSMTPLHRLLQWHQSTWHRCTGLFNGTRAPDLFNDTKHRPHQWHQSTDLFNDTAAHASSMTPEHLTPLHMPLQWHCYVPSVGFSARQRYDSAYFYLRVLAKVCGRSPTHNTLSVTLTLFNTIQTGAHVLPGRCSRLNWYIRT